MIDLHVGSSEAKPLITSSFVISGKDLDVETCTQKLGLEPTEVVARRTQTGRYLESHAPFYKEPYWSLDGGQAALDSIDVSLERLLEMLWPIRETIKGHLSSVGLSAAFVTSVVIVEDRPLYELSSETIRKLSFFDAEWRMDVID